jgi:precorrin-2 dehydrogenase / sirohydrochlorin ferrochelatase
LVERPFKSEDLDDAEIVILATDDKDLHVRIRLEAKSRKLLVNVADTPHLCDFYLGSTVKKGNLKIGISTNGKSPTLSKRLREMLEEILPEEIDELLDNLQAIRDDLKGDFAYKVQKLNEVTSILRPEKRNKV